MQNADIQMAGELRLCVFDASQPRLTLSFQHFCCWRGGREKGGLFCLISTTNMSAVVDTKKKNVGSVRLGDNNIC